MKLTFSIFKQTVSFDEESCDTQLTCNNLQVIFFPFKLKFKKKMSIIKVMYENGMSNSVLFFFAFRFSSLGYVSHADKKLWNCITALPPLR